MYEHHAEPLLPWARFVSRLVRHGGIALAILVFSLIVGTLGFHWLALQEWIDAFLNASMLLGGMGPIGEIQRTVGKLFASLYALYAGIVFLGSAVLVLAPIIHRVQHKLHLGEKSTRQ
jgi:hypothetical protein